MTLPVPNLDDRTFVDLVEDARARVAATCPEWTDLSPHDPGVALHDRIVHRAEPGPRLRATDHAAVEHAR